jgi:hypothetical protein
MSTAQFVNYALKENNMRQFAPCATFGLFGKRRTGKSTAASIIVRKLYQDGVRKFVVFCGNHENKVEWSRVIHPLFIHGKDLIRFEMICKYQSRIVGEDRERYEEAERIKLKDPTYVSPEYKVPSHLRLGVIHDDTGNDRPYMHSKIIKEVTSNGRHFGIDVMFLLQYITQLHIENRDQLDYVFLMQTSNERSIDRIFREYVTSTCCEQKTFQYLLAACTNKKGKCMMIDNASGSLLLQERIYYIKIPYPVPRVQVGGNQYVSYGKRHYLSTRRQKEEMAGHSNDASYDVKSTVDVVSHLSRTLDDNDDDHYPSDEDTVQLDTCPTDRGSVISLNRRRNINLSSIREGRHSYEDKKGNMFHVHLKKNTHPGVE